MTFSMSCSRSEKQLPPSTNNIIHNYALSLTSSSPPPVDPSPSREHLTRARDREMINNYTNCNSRDLSWARLECWLATKTPSRQLDR